MGGRLFLALGLPVPAQIAAKAPGQGSTPSSKLVVAGNARSASLSTGTSACTSPPLKSLTITPANGTIDGTETVQFTATGIDLIGDPIDLTFEVTWVSSLQSAVSIGRHDGVAKGHPVSGMARISAVHPPSKLVAQTDVTVTMKKVLGPDLPPPKKPAPELQSLKITPSDVSVAVDTRTHMKAMGKYRDGPAQDETNAVEWASTDETVMTVDVEGVATAHSVGTATLVVTEKNTMITNWVTVHVVPLELTALSIQSTEMSILPADFQQFHAVADYSDGSSIVLQEDVTWSSSDASIVRIDNDGKAIGRKAGAVELTAIYQSIGIKGAETQHQAKATVTVPEISGIEVKPEKPTMVIGETQRFQSMGVYSDGKRREVGLVTWTSSDDSLLGFHDAVGTGHGVGTVVVTATLNENSAIVGKTTVTLARPVPQRIRIEPVSPAAFDGVMVRGERLQFRALGVYAIGSGKEDVRPVAVTWSSDDPKVVAIDAKGMASSLGRGKTTISVEDADGVNLSVTIEVREPSSAPKVAARGGVVPPAVAKLYDDGKQKFEQLEVEVRALDSIPAFVRRLDEVRADIAKNPNRAAIDDAHHAHDQDLAIQGIQDQIDLAKKNAVSIQRHIDSILEATEDFSGRKQVQELRAKAKEEKARLKSWIQAAEVGFKIDADPRKLAEAGVKLLGVLIERFHKPIFDIEADKLEGILDVKRIKSLKDDQSQAKTDQADAQAAIERAQSLATQLHESAENWRKLAGEDFDSDDSAEGIFNFAELTVPLAKADDIVSMWAPDMRRAADAAAMAISGYLKKASIAKNEEPGPTLHAMADEAYRWHVQAEAVSKQADSLRQQLGNARDAALAALRSMTPRAKTRTKKKRSR